MLTHFKRPGVHRRTFLAAAGVACAPIVPSRVDAQTFPNHALKMVHAFSPGSVTDKTGRLIAERLAQRLSQPVVVENKPGASTIIGAEYAVKQPADGHTLVMVTSDMLSINAGLYKNPGFGPKDFDPITLVGQLPVVLMGGKGLPLTSLAELKAEYQRTKKAFSFGTWGVGSFAHMFAEMIRLETGIAFEYVPFQGAAPTNQALLGDHIDLAVNVGGSARQLIGNGQAKGIAVSAPARLSYLSDLPTFAEAGHPRVGATQWHGVAVRGGGQLPLIQRLYQEIAAVLADPDTQKRLLEGGYLKIDARPPSEFAKFIADDAMAWKHIIQASGIQVSR